MKKRRHAELMAELHHPPTPPTSDQESDGDFETQVPRLSSEENDKMLAKVLRYKHQTFKHLTDESFPSSWWSFTIRPPCLLRPARRWRGVRRRPPRPPRPPRWESPSSDTPTRATARRRGGEMRGNGRMREINIQTSPPSALWRRELHPLSPATRRDRRSLSSARTQTVRARSGPRHSQSHQRLHQTTSIKPCNDLWFFQRWQLELMSFINRPVSRERSPLSAPTWAVRSLTTNSLISRHTTGFTQVDIESEFKELNWLTSYQERNPSTVLTKTVTRFSPVVTSCRATRELTRARRSLSAPPAAGPLSGPTTCWSTSRGTRRNKQNSLRNRPKLSRSHLVVAELFGPWSSKCSSKTDSPHCLT